MKLFVFGGNQNKKIKEEPKEWYIDDDAIKKDLNVLRLNPKLSAKWDGLVESLKQNPYKLPAKYTPKDGLLYKGKKYHGYQLYHAVIDKSEKDRLFYIVKGGRVIFSELQYKGIVELLQALGHDW